MTRNPHMRFEAVVYFASPRTIFSGKVHADDVICRRPFPWKWLAGIAARCAHAMLDPSRCGYCVVDSSGSDVRHVEPKLKPAAKPKAGETHILGQ